MSEIQLKAINTDNVGIAETESNAVLQEIQTIDIKDQLSYERVASIRKTVNAKVKELDKERKEITVPLDTAKKKVMELYNNPLNICKKVIQTCDVMMIAYCDIQERKRKEEQDRLDRAAEKKRQELEAKAEANREEGKEGKAERYDEKAAEVMTPVAAPRVEKAQGVSYIERWNGEVIDKSIVPEQYKVVNQSMVDKVMQSTKGTLPIPGVKIIKTRTVTTRA